MSGEHEHIGHRLSQRLDYCLLYVVGSNEWQEAMMKSYEAANAWLSVSSYEFVETIVKHMEEEVNMFKQQLENGFFAGYGYEEMITQNKRAKEENHGEPEHH